MKVKSWMRVATYVLGIGLALAGFGSLYTIRAQNSAQRPETEHFIPSLDGPTLYVTYCAMCQGKV